MTDSSPTVAAEFRAGWRPLVACAFGLGLGLSPIQPFAAGIMATALQQAYGWPRAQILISLMVTPIILAVLSRPIGRLTDRVGARRVAIWSTVALGLAQLLLAGIASRLPLFYIGYGLMCAVSLGTLPMTYAKVINTWFVRARGMALGIALAATGIAGAIFPFLLTTANARWTWRGGYVALALLPLVIALPVLLAWLHERPGAPHAAAAHTAATAADRSEVRAAIRTARFITLAGASFLLSFGVSGLIPNLFPLLLAHDIDARTAASALAAMAISVTAGRIVTGFLLDRLWGPIVAAILLVPTAAALAMLLAPALTGPMLAGAVITLGFVAGAEFDLVAFMTARYFGQRHFSELYSIQYACFGVAAGFAPAIYGAIRDHTGSYAVDVALSAGLLLAAAAIYFTLGRYPAARETGH